MNKKYFLKHFEAMWEAIVTHICAFSETQKFEELHRLRIEIKKIFALTALIEANAYSFNFSSCLKPFKEIFMKAGEIRNIQLTLQAIVRYMSKNSSLYESQQVRLTNLTKMFCLKTDLHLKKLKKAHKCVSEKICDIETDYISRWYKNELRELELFFSEKSSQENIHEGRKMLKKLLYVYAILRKPLRNKLNLNKHYIHKLEKTIGKWHDTAVSMKILSLSSSSGNDVMKKLSKRKQKLLKACRELSMNFSEKVVAV